MCKKQTSVSHSSTESEIISLDASLRMDGKPALDLWDLIGTVLHGNKNQSKQLQGDPYKFPARKKIHGKIDDLDNVDFISSNVNSSLKDNEALANRYSSECNNGDKWSSQERKSGEMSRTSTGETCI